MLSGKNSKNKLKNIEIKSNQFKNREKSKTKSMQGSWKCLGLNISTAC
jgi:hypothetical protein